MRSSDTAGEVANIGGVAVAGTLASLGDVDAGMFMLLLVSVATARAGALALAIESGERKWHPNLIVFNFIYLLLLTLIALAVVVILGDNATFGWRIIIGGSIGALGPEILVILRDFGRGLLSRLTGKPFAPQREAENRPPPRLDDLQLPPMIDQGIDDNMEELRKNRD